MHWLWMRPLVGWTAFLIIHAIAIPVVYGMGKARGMNLIRETTGSGCNAYDTEE